MQNGPSTKRDRDNNKKERLLSKDYVLLMSSSFSVAMINHFFLAVMPLYIAYIGGSTMIAGFFISFYALAALAIRPVAGILSDKYGRCKLIIIGAAVISVFSFCNAFIVVIPVLLVIRMIQGLGFGLQSTSANAAAADVVPKSRLAEGIGYFTLYSTVAQAIGPSIALAIVAGDTMKDYQTLFFVSAAVCAAGATAGSLITYERKRKLLAVRAGECTEKSRATTQDRLPAISDTPLPKTLLGFEYAVFVPMAAIMLFNIALVSVFGFLAPYARWRGLTNPGLFFTISAMGVVVSRMIVGRIVDKRGADVIVIPSLAVLAGSLMLFSIVESRVAFFILALPIGLSQGALMPTFNTMIFRRCSPARRGTAAGAYFTAIDMGYVVGAPLLGALADAMDFRYIYWAAVVFAMLSLLLYLLACSDKRYNARILKSNKTS